MASIPNRVRYEVLRRDGYACHYCGGKAPDVKIEVDAVVPEALGGSHKDPANLITACKRCNGGKSSSSPDAPLVAEVAADAVRWSRAMQAAQARMLADLDARTKDHKLFREAWDSWTYVSNGERVPVPKGENWKQTVNSLRSAGLPLAVLLECADIALRRQRIRPESTFRYMCGIAWSKVTELQAQARGIAGGGDAGRSPSSTDAQADREDATYEQGRADLASELLGELGDASRRYYLADADTSGWGDDDDEPLTEQQLLSEAAEYAWSSVCGDRDYIVREVMDFLRGIPDGAGEQIIRQARTAVREDFGDHISKGMFVADALWKVLAHLERPAADGYLATLAAEERAEWLLFARALYPQANLSEAQMVVRAAECARVVNDDGMQWTAMCASPGDHIKQCPTLGAFRVWVNETPCCAEAGHEGHMICERHLSELSAGKHDHTVKNVLTVDDSEMAPF